MTTKRLTISSKMLNYYKQCKLATGTCKKFAERHKTDAITYNRITKRHKLTTKRSKMMTKRQKTAKMQRKGAKKDTKSQNDDSLVGSLLHICAQGPIVP